MKKEFEVIVKFKISGDMHPRVVDQHIKDNMVSEIESSVGEFEMHHEYYGKFDKISTMFLDGEIKMLKFEELIPEVIESRITKPTSLNERQNAVSVIEKYLATLKKAKS